MATSSSSLAPQIDEDGISLLNSLFLSGKTTALDNSSVEVLVRSLKYSSNAIVKQK